MRCLRRPKIWPLLLQDCVQLEECSWIIHTKTSVSSSHSKSLSKHYAVRNKKERQNKPLCDSNIPKWSLKHPPLGHKTAFFNSVCCTMKHMRSFLAQASWIETGIFYKVFFSYPPFLPPLKTTPSLPVQEGSLSGNSLPMIPIALEGTWWPLLGLQNHLPVYLGATWSPPPATLPGII